LKVDKEIKVTTTIVNTNRSNKTSKSAKKPASAPNKQAKSTSVKKPKAKIVIKSSSKKNEKKPTAS
jgi:hypothetical protein